MNKYVRILVVFIIVAVLVLLTWKSEASQQGMLVTGSFPTLEPVPIIVVTPTAAVENTVSMRNLVLVEFFAGY
jgi:hypothetical protein